MSIHIRRFSIRLITISRGQIKNSLEKTQRFISNVAVAGLSRTTENRRQSSVYTYPFPLGSRRAIPVVIRRRDNLIQRTRSLPSLVIVGDLLRLVWNVSHLKIPAMSSGKLLIWGSSQKCDRFNCRILLYPMDITNQEVLRRVQLKKACLLVDIRKKRVTLDISSDTAHSNMHY